MRRAGRSGSKITVNPACLPMVSNMILVSLTIFKLMGERASGFNWGGCSA
jgi:hypothetical protein